MNLKEKIARYLCPDLSVYRSINKNPNDLKWVFISNESVLSEYKCIGSIEEFKEAMGLLIIKKEAEEKMADKRCWGSSGKIPINLCNDVIDMAMSGWISDVEISKHIGYKSKSSVKSAINKNLNGEDARIPYQKQNKLKSLVKLWKERKFETFQDFLLKTEELIVLSGKLENQSDNKEFSNLPDTEKVLTTEENIIQ